MNQDEILFDTEERMEKALTVLKTQLSGLRTGRANSGLVDSIKIDVYGSPSPLKQIANISVPEPQQIAIRPFDAGHVSLIVKAIQASDMGLAPQSDGRIIRLNIPPLSTDTRRKLSNRIKELAEESRITLRNVRRDGNKHADTSQKAKILTEDQVVQVKDEVQAITKKFEALINTLAAEKESQIMDSWKAARH